MPFCTKCGHENPAGSRFCAACGAPLQADRPGVSDQTATIALDADGEVGSRFDLELPPAEQSAVEALPSGSALLIVPRGPGAGSRFLLDTEVVTAGRHPQSEIFLDDVTVSRRHAEFVRTAAGYRVRDVGSLNGTYVNRDRIDEVGLISGDEVQIGKFRLMYYASVRGFLPSSGMPATSDPAGDEAVPGEPASDPTAGAGGGTGQGGGVEEDTGQ